MQVNFLNMMTGTALLGLSVSAAHAGVVVSFEVGGQTYTPALVATTPGTITDPVTGWSGPATDAFVPTTWSPVVDGLVATVAMDELAVNSDPFVLGAFSFVNPTAVPQVFTVTQTVILPVPIIGGTLYGGSIGITLTDGGNGVASVSTSGGIAAYQGKIDGVTQLELFSDPFTFAPVLFPGGSATTSTFAGLSAFGPTLVGPDALASISITHRVVVSARDAVGITSFFVVEPIPEPGALGLLVPAALTMLRRRR